MELRHLRYFIAVAEEQNVTRPAARLHVSQPPLSRQIRDLEAELQLQLFERSAKSIRLTPAGAIFLQEARAVLERMEQAVQTTRAVATGQAGEVPVGYAPSLTIQFLPTALRLFQEKAPDVRIVLHDLSTEEMIEQLRKGRIQLAFMIQAPAKSLAGLKFEELRQYAVCVAAHPAHPLSRRRSLTLAAIAQDRLLGYSHAEYPEYQEWLKNLFAPIGAQPRIAEEHDGVTSLIAAVEAGRGVALVPESFSCLSGIRLKLLRIADSQATLTVGVAHRDAALPVAAAQFLEVARRAASPPKR